VLVAGTVHGRPLRLLDRVAVAERVEIVLGTAHDLDVVGLTRSVGADQDDGRGQPIDWVSTPEAGGGLPCVL
jgi:hypothetical protein